jgi:hypothetical protein
MGYESKYRYSPEIVKNPIAAQWAIFQMGYFPNGLFSDSPRAKTPVPWGKTAQNSPGTQLGYPNWAIFRYKFLCMIINVVEVIDFDSGIPSRYHF